MDATSVGKMRGGWGGAGCGGWGGGRNLGQTWQKLLDLESGLPPSVPVEVYFGSTAEYSPQFGMGQPAPLPPPPLQHGFEVEPSRSAIFSCHDGTKRKSMRRNM